MRAVRFLSLHKLLIFHFLLLHFFNYVYESALLPHNNLTLKLQRMQKIFSGLLPMNVSSRLQLLILISVSLIITSSLQNYKILTLININHFSIHKLRLTSLFLSLIFLNELTSFPD